MITFQVVEKKRGDFLKKISNYKILYISAFVIMIIIIIIFCYLYDKKESEKISIEHQDIVGIENIENSTMEVEHANLTENHIVVHVDGKVNNPGVYELNENARVKDAIDAANGITDEADMKNVNLAYSLSDGQKVYIPGSESEESYQNISGIISGGEEKIKININTAGQAELESISGIGPSLASKIISYRAENGKFKSNEDLKNVPGIGDAKYEGLKDEICVK